MKNRISTIFLSMMLLAMVASCSGGGNSESASGGTDGGSTVDPSVSLVSIEVSPVDPIIALGTATQLKATGVYSDNTKKDLTSSVEWDSSDIAVATVHNGLARSIARGSASIKAASGNISGSRTLTVTTAALVSIHITPVNPNAALGATSQFTATGIFSDDSVQELTSQVTWSSSDGSIASVSNAAGSRGLAIPAGIGTTTVSATLDGVTGSTDFTVTEAVLVSIQVTPTNPSLAKGTTRQLTATGIYSDHSTQDLTKQVLWISSNTSVASIRNAAGSNGLASALAVGSAGVSAALGQVSGTMTLDVTEETLVSIEVSPMDPRIAKGTKRQFTATGLYSDNSTQDLTLQVTWSASDTCVASISNADDSRGLATPAGFGSTAIYATLGGIWGSATLAVSNASLVSITVTPDRESIQGGKSLQFTATGHYSNGMTQDITKSAVWKSSDNKVAKISNAKKERGLATGGDAGTTTITATLSKKSGSATLTVSE